MTVYELQQKILDLKKEKDICILAHSYEAREISEIADFVGDSYALSVKAKSVPQKTVIMCGVRFMAETVKILSPQKKVILANPDAGCPMAEQMDKELIEQLKSRDPNRAVVAYINTTTDLKTICDVCVTSSSAVKIINNMPEKDILFIPDINLGTYVANQCPDKSIKLVHGGCPTHCRVRESNVLQAKKEHPNALFLVHPECTPDVVKHADYVGSTSGIMDYAKKSSAKEFIIGTENSITEHLQYDCPDKKFYPVSKDLVCHNMKITTLPEVYLCCRGEFGEEITLDEETRLKAEKCINKMIEYGG
ncbi:MAG: quinolinate synthase NadA [Clostridiales bacterium]|nr:quinolinate synthase NadA [Clostridiales bacterium]